MNTLNLNTYCKNASPYALLYVVLFFAGTMVVNPASAQQEKLLFHNSSQGIPQYSVSSIDQDSLGFIWIGTRYGLQRYNGLDFEPYLSTPDSSSEQSAHIITALTVDVTNNIWVGTNGGGLRYYNFTRDQFDTLPIKDKPSCAINARVINAIFEDTQGNIWVATVQNGLYVLKVNSRCFKQFTPRAGNSQSISSLNISAIMEDGAGRIWVGTWDSGLNLFNESDSTFQRFTPQNTPNLTHGTVRSLLWSKRGQLIAGTGNGPKIISRKNDRFVFNNLLPPSHTLSEKLHKTRVLSLESDPKGNIWIGTENEGLYRVNIKKKKARNFQYNPDDPGSLCSNSIWSLFWDDRNILWIGTFNQGLCKLDPNEQKFPRPLRSKPGVNSINSNVVSSFSEDSLGNIWIGTEGGGLNYFNPKKNTFDHFTHRAGDSTSISSNYVVCLTTDKQQNLWVGTWEGGLNRKVPGKDKFVHYWHQPGNSNSLANNDVYTLLEDNKGNIWVSCFRAGLDVIHPNRKTISHFSTEASLQRRIESEYVRSIFQDKDGYIWLGTEGDGLLRIKVNDSLHIVEKQQFSSRNSTLPNDYITEIFQSNNGTLWVGTEGGGLLYTHPSHFTFSSVNKSDGLSGNIVYSIQETNDSLLWISTNQGLSQYNLKRGAFRNFNPGGNRSSGFYRSSSLKTHSGYLLFGGIWGFHYFHPSQIPLNPVPPRVYITHFQLQSPENKSQPKPLVTKNSMLQDSLQLRYWQNDFQIKVAALNYSEASKNQYAYKLERYDQMWRKTTNPDEIYYNNVPPGTYTLKVKASNNDQIWSTNITTLHLHITPPWYKTTWAYLAYALFLAGLLVLARWNIIRNERLRNELKLEHIQLEQVKELSKMRLKFFTYISHEFRTPLTLIIAPLQELLQNDEAKHVSKPLQMMLNNARRLLLLINQILDLSKIESGFLKLETQRQDLVILLRQLAVSFSVYADDRLINFKLDFPKEEIMLYYDSDKLEKVLINLLSNAFKFTPRFGNVTLSLRKKGNEVKITVEDSGDGISQHELKQIFKQYYQIDDGEKHTGTGIGLALSKELVELHKGSITVKSKKGKGSQFEVTLPLGKKHLQEHEIIPGKNTEPAESKPLNNALEIDLPYTSTHEESIPKDVTKPLLLIVEDNQDLRNFLTSMFENEYKVLACSNGFEALKISLDEIPDAIISDIVMPRMDGNELCKKLKEKDATSHIPIILLTAKASTSSISQGFESGAIFYITKPFDPQLLRLRLRNILTNLNQYKQSILENKGIKLEPNSVSIPDTDQQFLEKVIETVNANLSDASFQVSDLSKALNISKPQLYRKMKGLMGCSANEFIRTIRLKNAAMLLRNGQLSVAETTYRVGFNDLQYFRKCFVNQYGVTPSEYIAQNNPKS